MAQFSGRSGVTATAATCTAVTDFRDLILPFLAPSLRGKCADILAGSLPGLEEIRIRCGRPLMAITGNGDFFITPQGAISQSPVHAYLPDREDLNRSLQLLGQGSAYALEEQLRSGYITIPGGHRVGLCGKAIVDSGRIVRLIDISGLNYRLARAIKGLADPIMRYLVVGGRPLHTLIVSPPRAGKTTLLRDIVRQWSTGIPKIGFAGVKVGLVDERSEVAACYGGVPQMDVGVRTDILDSCPKAEGILLLIRSMSPQVIATDELGGHKDIEAVEELINAGASLLTTAHGNSMQDLVGRPGLARLMEWKVFERYIFLGRSLGIGTVENLTDRSLNSLITGKLVLRPGSEEP
ncbi:MAG: stage III sporulation protein AA [Bacillota bacterium]